MSLVLGIEHEHGWVIAGDSCHIVDGLRVPGAPKVHRLVMGSPWVVGHVGGCDDSYAYIRGLTGDEPFDSPAWHVERMAWWRELCRRMGDDSAKPIEPNIVLLWSRGKECFAVNDPTGHLVPADRYVAIGCGQYMALLLLYEALGLHGELPTVERATEIAFDVITRVAAVDSRIALPIIIEVT